MALTIRAHCYVQQSTSEKIYSNILFDFLLSLAFNFSSKPQLKWMWQVEKKNTHNKYWNTFHEKFTRFQNWIKLLSINGMYVLFGRCANVNMCYIYISEALAIIILSTRITFWKYISKYSRKCVLRCSLVVEMEKLTH